jgi:rod shape-determining protein MreD
MLRGKRYLKYALLAALILLTALAQNAFLPAFGARRTGWLLLALLSVIAMHETELTTAVFALLAGVLWDLASPLPDGMLALYLTVFACACSLLARCLFRKTLLTAAVLCAGGSFLFCLLSLLLRYTAKNAAALTGVTLHSLLPSLLLTAIALPVFYYVIRAIEIRSGANAGKTL